MGLLNTLQAPSCRRTRSTVTTSAWRASSDARTTAPASPSRGCATGRPTARTGRTRACAPPAGHPATRLVCNHYRVIHLLCDLCWVDFEFSCSIVCQVLLVLMGMWRKRLGSWARWWNTQVNPTQVYEQMNHPVIKHGGSID